MRARDKHGCLIPFSCSVCTYNRKTGAGGQLLVINSAVLSEKGSKAKSNSAVSNGETAKRSIHHVLNATKNILLIPSNEIRTIHIRLIEKFNSKTVYD